MKSNILLIGMPATGKSTLGKLLANRKKLTFIDVDNIITDSAGRPAQEILDSLGDDGYGELEAKALNSIDGKGFVIATGGSAIYQKKEIVRLKKTSLAIHLQATEPILLERIHDFEQRAIVRAKALSFSDLYAERLPLYNAMADIQFDTNHAGSCPEDAVTEIIKRLENSSQFSFTY